MRLLLDESVPAKLRRYLPAHEVRTVVEVGWQGVKNGRLLALAAEAFDALITVDKNMPHQQNASALPFPVFVLSAHSVELAFLLPLLAELESKLLAERANAFVVISPRT
jgi:predicted nuclease of predicted toxin-antitoxin system